MKVPSKDGNETVPASQRISFPQLPHSRNLSGLMFEPALPLIWRPIPSIVSREINLRPKVVERVGYLVFSNPYGFYQ